MVTLLVRTRVERQGKRLPNANDRHGKESRSLRACQPSQERSGGHTKAVGRVRRITSREGCVGVDRNRMGHLIMVAVLAVAGAGQFCASACQHSEGSERQR
jgi:hypothetical protein